MEGEIKLQLNEELIMECGGIVFAGMTDVRLLKFIKYAGVLPVMLWQLYVAIRGFSEKGRFNMVHIACFLLYVFLFWFCSHGARLRMRSQLKKMMKSRKISLEYTVTFNEHGIKAASENSMFRVKWENITKVYENESYWIFGSRCIIVDKRLLTKEQFAFLKEKSDIIKNLRRHLF